MNTGRVVGNRLVGGLFVMLLALSGAIYLGSGARTAALNTVARNVATHMSAALGAGGDPQAVARRLVASRSVEPTFLSVRGPDHQLLASAGAWSGPPYGLISRATAQTWRAWLYRTLCAETRRSLADGASMHVGVAWWRILARAGIGFWLLLPLMAFGLAVVVRVCGRRAGSAAAPERSVTATVQRWRLSMPDSVSTWRARWARERIVAGRSSNMRASDAGPKPAGFQPIGRRGIPPVFDAPAVAPMSWQGAVEPVVVETQSPDETGRSEGAQPSSSLARLRLRFQPIWRDAAESLLAGAANAALARGIAGIRAG